MRLEGIHHITAITADARRNLDFYTGVLGLRLVKKTINQDSGLAMAAKRGGFSNLDDPDLTHPISQI